MESEDDDFYNSDDYSDDTDNYDSLDEVDDDSDGVADHRLREKNFTILREEDIRRRQEDDIVNTAAVLGVSREAALILLRHYNWRVNDVHDEWFADEERLRKAVGLLKNSVVAFSGFKKFLCKICLDELPIDKSSSIACGHPFCNECWRGYIRTSINDGPGCLMLKCPEPSCGAAVGQDMVDMLVFEEDKGKYLSYLVRSYVEENKKIKWCPAPGCDCAVEFVFGSENYDVTCGCSYSFCWNCTVEAHRPVDCDTVSKWILKNSAESENMNWLLVNSKPCPNCKRPIEKNQGCMHMTCRMCKHQFCWLCLENWKDHGQETGGFYACNRYQEQKQEGKINEAERLREMAKKALDKYMHYYERWVSNQSAMRKAKVELKQMQDVTLEKLRERHVQPQSQMVFIPEAWKQIIECRRVLKWTYAYGYYLPEHEKIKKQLFEYLQGEAEAALEKLHHCTEQEILSYLPCNKESPNMSFEEFRTKLVDLTRVTKNYFENLVRALENGLADVDPTSQECVMMQLLE